VIDMRLFGFLMGLVLVAIVIFTFSRGGFDELDFVRLQTGFPITPQVGGPEPAKEETGSGPGGDAVPVASQPVPPVIAEPPVNGAAADPLTLGPEAPRPPFADPDTTEDGPPDPVDQEADLAARQNIPDAPAAAPTLPEDRWEAFFTPFRSEASALGFAGFLQRTTGREFVVRRAGPGDYRVWFRLAAGESRPERLAEIEKVTGMALAGGEF
jgi:hypothetical protein